MSNSTVQPVPAYFEESWAILSTIGLINILFGFMIIAITSLSPLALVPIITSAAGAIANGLCYYAFYADYSKTPTMAAAAFADAAWLIQEAGMSFYSYLILIRVLTNQSRVVFISIFWAIMVILLIIRSLILISRAKDILDGNTSKQYLVDHLHIGYFSSIALVECTSAFFLLRKFASAKRGSVAAASTSGLFKYLMRSTEVRLTVLAAIGVSRAITYTFQTTAQSATNVASQIDRFVYTLECLFPIMMFFDILASRLIALSYTQDSSSQSQSRRFTSASKGRKDRGGKGDVGMYSMNNVETRVDANGQVFSSQERIIDGIASHSGTGEGSEGFDINGKHGGISKTVEFEFHEFAV